MGDLANVATNRCPMGYHGMGEVAGATNPYGSHGGKVRKNRDIVQEKWNKRESPLAQLQQRYQVGLMEGWCSICSSLLRGIHLYVLRLFLCLHHLEKEPDQSMWFWPTALIIKSGVTSKILATYLRGNHGKWLENCWKIPRFHDSSHERMPAWRFSRQAWDAPPLAGGQHARGVAAILQLETRSMWMFPAKNHHLVSGVFQLDTFDYQIDKFINLATILWRHCQQNWILYPLKIAYSLQWKTSILIFKSSTVPMGYFR